jgi:hypothetical protein
VIRRRPVSQSPVPGTAMSALFQLEEGKRLHWPLPGNSCGSSFDKMFKRNKNVIIQKNLRPVVLTHGSF